MDPDAWPDLKNPLTVLWFENPLQVLRRMVAPGDSQGPAQQVRHGRWVRDTPVPGRHAGSYRSQEPSEGPRQIAPAELHEAQHARCKCPESRPVVRPHPPRIIR